MKKFFATTTALVLLLAASAQDAPKLQASIQQGYGANTARVMLKKP